MATGYVAMPSCHGVAVCIADGSTTCIAPTWQELDFGLFHVGMEELTAGMGTMHEIAEPGGGDNSHWEAWLREYSSPSYVVGGGATPLFLRCALITTHACLDGNTAMCWPLRRHQQSRTSSSRWFPNSATGSSPQAMCTMRGFAALVHCCHRLTMIWMSSDRYSVVEVIEPNQEIRERLVVVRDPRGSVAGITDMAQKLDGFKYVDDLPQDLASALKDPKRYVGIQPRACVHAFGL